jgi:hypothetical protein
MPVIHIEYDSQVVSDIDIQRLCKGAHEVAAKVTGIEDVPVYANASQINFAIAPIEIFVRLSRHKIKDLDALMGELKKGMAEWKTGQKFNHKINMSLIPMDWKIEIDI